MSANNTFQSVKKWAEGPFTIWVFFISIILVGIGFVHFAEDTYSSYIGMQTLVSAYMLYPASFPITYWSMSLAPQIGQIAFGYAYLSNRRKNGWMLIVVAILFTVDFVADIYHRSNGVITFDTRGAIAGGITLGYFTIGSELFITLGMGLVLATLPGAIRQSKIITHNIGTAVNQEIKTPQQRPRPKAKPVTKSPIRQRPQPPHGNTIGD